MLFRPKLLLFAVLCAFLLPMTASAAPSSGYDDDPGVTCASEVPSAVVAPAVDVALAADPQLLPDLVPQVQDLEVPALTDWSRSHLYIGGLDGTRRRPRRGKKRGGGLTKSQRLFKEAAQTCQRELRAGELNTRAGMGACMRSELKDRGFKIGAGRRKGRKK